jgi:hypothetical protein
MFKITDLMKIKNYLTGFYNVPAGTKLVNHYRRNECPGWNQTF